MPDTEVKWRWEDGASCTEKDEPSYKYRKLSFDRPTHSSHLTKSQWLWLSLFSLSLSLNLLAFLHSVWQVEALPASANSKTLILLAYFRSMPGPFQNDYETFLVYFKRLLVSWLYCAQVRIVFRSS
jgi:hypothetical protein